MARETLDMGDTRMFRRLALGLVAVLIVVVTLVSAERNTSDPPSFSVATGIYVDGDFAQFKVKCHATGPGALDSEVSLSSPANRAEIYPRMNPDDLKSYGESWGIVMEGQRNAGQSQEHEDFIKSVHENTQYYCSQFRENRQTVLVMIYGTSLALLALVAIAAILTARRPRLVVAAATPPATPPATAPATPPAE